MTTKERVCDECGEPATNFARDIMVRPNPDLPTEMLSKSLDPLRCGCDQHPVKSVAHKFKEPWPKGVRYEDLPSTLGEAKDLTPNTD